MWPCKRCCKLRKSTERERESMRNGSFALVFWLVRMETGRLKALNSIGAQTLNPNSMPSFVDQTKPFFNYAQVRVLANLEPTPTLIFFNWYFSHPGQILTYSKFVHKLNPTLGTDWTDLSCNLIHMHKIVQILFYLQNVW